MKMYRAMGLQNTSAGADSKSGIFVSPTAVRRGTRDAPHVGRGGQGGDGDRPASQGSAVVAAERARPVSSWLRPAWECGPLSHILELPLGVIETGQDCLAKLLRSRDRFRQLAADLLRADGRGNRLDGLVRRVLHVLATQRTAHGSRRGAGSPRLADPAGALAVRGPSRDRLSVVGLG